MLIMYGPIHQVMADLNAERLLDKGTLKSKTQTLDQLLTDLVKTQLPVWQQAIRNTYAEGTAGWTNLFPQGLYPFNSGSKDNKIDAVKVLRNACNGDAAPAVQAVGATVGAYYTLLLNARAAQTGKKTEIGTDIPAVKSAIKDMCVAQFANYGGLIQKYASTPATVAAFIDFVTLYSLQHSSMYEGTINASAIKKICTHKFAPVSTIVVTNDGDADIRLWIAESAKASVHPVGVTVPKATVNMVIQVVNLGNPTHRILMMQNLDPVTPGAYEVYVGTKNSDPLTDPHD
jgi:hypothetical protein